MPNRFWIRVDAEGRALREEFSSRDWPGEGWMLLPLAEAHTLGAARRWLYEDSGLRTEEDWPIARPVRRHAIVLAVSDARLLVGEELVVDVQNLPPGEKARIRIGDEIIDLGENAPHVVRPSEPGVLLVALEDARFHDEGGNAGRISVIVERRRRPRASA